ncbi:MAG: hypothetical protein GY828_03985 [Candidatus Gracilibacteria bacterium]|nr:hypothetical protein [Candidatus Gracilibacteria bacterium]
MEFGQISQELYRVGKEYAQAKAKSEMLAESRKSVIAKIASEQEGSEATKERIARASPEYKEYLHGARGSRQRELELKYELDSLQMSFEYERSMNSLKKKEINML